MVPQPVHAVSLVLLIDQKEVSLLRVFALCSFFLCLINSDSLHFILQVILCFPITKETEAAAKQGGCASFLPFLLSFFLSFFLFVGSPLLPLHETWRLKLLQWLQNDEEIRCTHKQSRACTH